MQVSPNRSDSRAADESGTVLPFPRRRLGLPRFPGRDAGSEHSTADPSEAAPADDFARYEAEEYGPVDYRQRMLMNLLSVMIVAILVSAGVWIADTIAIMQRDQDCVMQGRVNCAPIEVPARAQQ
jgi:hypothetical protein